ncbi:hypothetical protein ACW9I4_13035 [Pseudomonas sp. SDT2931_S440]
MFFDAPSPALQGFFIAGELTYLTTDIFDQPIDAVYQNQLQGWREAKA